MSAATTVCRRTLAEHLEDVIGLYQANLELWADRGEDFAREKAIADVLHDWDIPCLQLGRALCAACQTAE